MSRRVSAMLVGAALLLGLVAGPAAAHVTVNPREATGGGFAKLSFRVPTERDDASTVKVEVKFPDPEVAAFPRASVQPHPGWTYAVEKVQLDDPIESDDGPITEVVDTITWTADDPANGIKPGEFDEFNVSLGPLPTDVDQITFKAIQTYSSGEVVSWIDERTGDDEPEHPAPVLQLTKATATTTAGDTASASSVDDDDVDRARALGLVGTVVGTLGFVAAVAAIVLGRRRG
jgi:uncharacterized protein YcnI